MSRWDSIAGMISGARTSPRTSLTLDMDCACCHEPWLRDNLVLLGAGARDWPAARRHRHARDRHAVVRPLPTSAGGLLEAMFLLAAASRVAAALPAWRAARVRLDEALRCE